MKVNGLGGVFWRTKNLENSKKWYREVLKIDIENWNGAMITSKPDHNIIFSLFSEEDDYFPTDQQVMLNFQVENLEDSIDHLEKKGVPLVMEKTVSEYGKFIWIEDPDGRRIELWEK
ncbi:VOC family protein [Halobacillus rhizosphaerae]|uniref:VOC family protein n=1 Tax=Halobacillus rhizosphaerae TaxID=3064889 RepID=UPI00398ACFB5